MSKRLFYRLSALCIITASLFCLPAHGEENSVAVNSTHASSNNDHIWKQKKKIMVGYSTGQLDRKIRFGGKISSRWGASIITGRNIYLHPKPIGGFVKIGLNIDMNINYLNFAKGSGKVSDIMNPGIFEDLDESSPTSEVSLGEHYLTAGIALGPNATFAPFFASNNKNLSTLKFRPYFHVVPSYASYMVSNQDDIEMHNAFALWCSSGLEIQWKRLIVGLGWKGCTAKYKGLIDNLLSDLDEEHKSSGSYKFDTNMFNVSIGIAF